MQLTTNEKTMNQGDQHLYDSCIIQITSVYKFPVSVPGSQHFKKEITSVITSLQTLVSRKMFFSTNQMAVENSETKCRVLR